MRSALLKSLVLPVLFFVHCGLCRAENQAPLTQIEQVVGLTSAQAAKGLPVRLEGTVTFVEAPDSSLFIQSDGYGTYVNFSKDRGLVAGDRVVVSGVTDASFRPEVTASDVQFVAHGSLPAPQPAKFEDLIQARLDSRYVVIRGHVLSVATRNPGLRIQIRVDRKSTRLNSSHVVTSRMPSSA